MRNIHSSLSNKYPWYQKWHTHPGHAMVHWVVFLFMMVLFSSMFFQVLAGSSRDRIKPVITSFAISETSTSLDVSITNFTATDNRAVAGYIVKESSTTPSSRSSSWQNTVPTKYTFTSEGSRTLYAWVKDSSGNISSTSTDSTVISTGPGPIAPPATDTTAPVVADFNIPSTSITLTVSFNSFTATDDIGVTGYKVTESATTPLVSDIDWNLSYPSYTFSSAGTKTLYGWAKDAAGNISAPKSASVVITLPDTTAPVISSFTIPSTSTSLIVSFGSLTATDTVGVTGYLVTESSSTPSLSNTAWSMSFPSYTFSTQGSKTLYAWAKDAAGNVSAPKSASVVITLSVVIDPTPVITGKTYYLSPSGSDVLGTGSISSPWFSLNKAWTVVTAGDLVYLRGGTYAFNSQQYLTGKNGTSSNFINVWAYPGETPNLTKSSTYTAGAGIYFKGNYVYFKGLEISGYKQTYSSLSYGLRVENSNYNKFELLNIHDNGLGLNVANYGYTEHSTGNLVLNSDFHHNADPLTSGDPYGNGDGADFGWITHPEDVNTVSGCRFWSNSDDGLDLFKNDGKVIVENSWAFKNGYIPGTTTSAGDGNGFKLGDSINGYPNDVKRVLTNNLSFSNRASGFDLNGGRFKTEEYNNTSYANGNRGFRMADDAYGEGLSHTAKNNIGYMNSSLNGEFSPSSIVTYDTFTLNGGTNTNYSISSLDFLSLDSSGTDGARQANGNLPNLNFLKLVSGSDLVNRGVNVGLQYLGTAPDLGYAESGY